MASLRDRNVAPSGLNAVLFGSFALVALLAAAVGILGALAFSVSQRVREFGVRMAVGATAGSVLWKVLQQGILMIMLGLALGGIAAVALARALASFLFGVAPLDPLSLGLAAVALGVGALGAALLPAIHATQIQPAEALRAE